MATFEYEEILSRLLTKIEAYDFIDMTNNQIEEYLSDWIKSVSANPYLRKQFSSLTVDSDSSEISFELSYPIDDGYDQDFVVELFSLGVGLKWLQPKINSIQHIAQLFGSNDEKFYSQKEHLSGLLELQKRWKKEFDDLLHGRGYLFNSYLDGES